MRQFNSKFNCLLILLVTTGPGVAQRSTIAPCNVGTTAPGFGWWAWAPNTTVKVYILVANFKDNELPYVVAPIKKWNQASGATGTKVNFEYAGETSIPLHCVNCLTIMRGQVFDKLKRHATELRAYSGREDQLITWG